MNRDSGYSGGCMSILKPGSLMSFWVILFLINGKMTFAQKAEEKAAPTDPFIVQSLERQQKSEWDQLIQECDRVLQAEPTKGAAMLFRGIALNGKGEYDDAIKEFARVLELPNRDPMAMQNRADAYSNRSVSYYRKNEFLKAIDSTTSPCWKSQPR